MADEKVVDAAAQVVTGVVKDVAPDANAQVADAAVKVVADFAKDTSKESIADAIKDAVVENVKPNQGIIARTVAAVLTKIVGDTVTNKIVRTLLIVIITAASTYFTVSADGTKSVEEVTNAVVQSAVGAFSN